MPRRSLKKKLKTFFDVMANLALGLAIVLVLYKIMEFVRDATN